MPSTTPRGVPTAIQVAALLDVQLEIRVISALADAGVHDAIGVPANLPDAIGPANPVPRLLEIRGLDVPRDDAAAGETAAECHALFVRPDDDLERMPRTDSGSIARFDDTKSRQRPEIAVEIATARHGVDV